MASFTPGAWKIHIVNSEEQWIYTGKLSGNGHRVKTTGNFICRIASECDLTPEDKANAHLIAAAPDLLLAAKEAAIMLKEIAEAYGRTPNGPGFDHIMAAIAKAEGRSNA